MKLSRYVRCFTYGEDVLLYNTVDHGIIQLPASVMTSNEIRNDLDSESITALRDMGYLSDTDLAIQEKLSSYLINTEKLFISVELNLSCNLRCPYCYQAGKQDGKCIKPEDLDALAEYVNKVYNTSHFKDLYIKILGGEPTLVWDRFLYIHNRIADICEKKKIKYHLLIDTNGTIIDGILSLSQYDSLLLTIPLTYRDCHDKVRYDAKGNGTYDKIINNVAVIHRKKPEAKIVLRYNVDQENKPFFGLFLHDIRAKLDFEPLVSVNYTAELNEIESYKNPLSYRDFVDWSSTTAIDCFIEARMPITISPIISIEECQFRSRFSLKLFSDGTVGSCAMDFFRKNRTSIVDLVNHFDKGCDFTKQKEKQTIIINKECMECDSVFLCGGTNKLPCITSLDKNLCRDKKFGVNLCEFIKRYVNSQSLGLDDLFVVFQQGESYR